MRRIVTLVAVTIVVVAGCGFDGEGSGPLGGSGLEAGGAVLPDGGDPNYFLDGSVEGSSSADAAKDAASTIPICTNDNAWCASKMTCVNGCDNNSNCTQRESCWVCPGGVGPPRRICASSCGSGGSGCTCKTTADCAPDELCGPGGKCVSCGASHVGSKCKNGNTCTNCGADGFECGGC